MYWIRSQGGHQTLKNKTASRGHRLKRAHAMTRIRTCHLFVVFFFQAEDGIRDVAVTGVQTCALPISRRTSTNSTFISLRRAPRAAPEVPSLRFASTTMESHGLPPAPTI